MTFYCYYLLRHENLIALTDENVKVVAEYKYDAWGNLIAETRTFGDRNPYRSTDMLDTGMTQKQGYIICWLVIMMRRMEGLLLGMLSAY